MTNHRQQFIGFALQRQALAFGDFTTKAGRRSPYFFNTGRFDSGASVAELGRFYAMTLIAAERNDGLAYDMLFGPAYKGITLAAATAMALSAIPAADGGRDVGFAYNRKKAKTHGDSGLLVGARLEGRVVIIDDVLTDGASKRESVDIIRAAGAEPVAVLIAMDRMERKDETGPSRASAVQSFAADYGIPVYAIANLDDLMAWLASDAAETLAAHAGAVAAYRERYGAAADAADTAGVPA